MLSLSLWGINAAGHVDIAVNFNPFQTPSLAPLPLPPRDPPGCFHHGDNGSPREDYEGRAACLYKVSVLISEVS